MRKVEALLGTDELLVLGARLRPGHAPLHVDGVERRGGGSGGVLPVEGRQLDPLHALAGSAQIQDAEVEAARLLRLRDDRLKRVSEVLEQPIL